MQFFPFIYTQILNLSSATNLEKHIRFLMPVDSF